MGEYPHPNLLWGLGEHRELPQWGPERPKTNLGHNNHRTPDVAGKSGIL